MREGDVAEIRPALPSPRHARAAAVEEGDAAFAVGRGDEIRRGVEGWRSARPAARRRWSRSVTSRTIVKGRPSASGIGWWTPRPQKLLPSARRRLLAAGTRLPRSRAASSGPSRVVTVGRTGAAERAQALLVAAERAGRGVGGQHGAVGAGAQHRIHAVLEQHAEALLALVQAACLGLQPRGGLCILAAPRARAPASWVMAASVPTAARPAGIARRAGRIDGRVCTAPERTCRSRPPSAGRPPASSRTLCTAGACRGATRGAGGEPASCRIPAPAGPSAGACASRDVQVQPPNRCCSLTSSRCAAAGRPAVCRGRPPGHADHARWDRRCAAAARPSIGGRQSWRRVGVGGSADHRAGQRWGPSCRRGHAPTATAVAVGVSRMRRVAAAQRGIDLDAVALVGVEQVVAALKVA